MSKSMPEEREFDSFIFTHIPKCGGTSFRHYINDAAINSGIPVEEIYIPGCNDLANEKNIPQLTEEELAAVQKKRLRILACHSKFDVEKEYNLNISKAFYFTLLREPVARFISHYNFFNYKLGYNECKGVPLNELPEEKLDWLLGRLGNVQTRHLANIKLLKVVGMDNILKIAKYNLLFCYDCFGLLEELETSIKLLRKKCPAWLIFEAEFPTKNKNEEQKPEYKGVISKIKEANKRDLDLYAFAKSHFENLADKTGVPHEISN